MKSPDELRIAGNMTVADWKSLRVKLDGSNDPGLWDVAFRDFFLKRLAARYFEPIKTLQASQHRQGEGFAIVAIQCSLIEFLGATLAGKTYRVKRDFKDEATEYYKSGEMFVGFLSTNVPFSDLFDKATAQSFYEGVRCPLLHEARTSKGWTIRTRPATGPFIDPVAKIVYRDDLQNAFDKFTDWYGSTLPNDTTLQRAFLHKFDSLCEE